MSLGPTLPARPRLNPVVVKTVRRKPAPKQMAAMMRATGIPKTDSEKKFGAYLSKVNPVSRVPPSLVKQVKSHQASIEHNRYQSPAFASISNFNTTASQGHVLQPIKIKNKVWVPTGKQEFSKPTRLVAAKPIPRSLYY